MIAKSAGIQIVHLDADSTTTDYVLKFLDNVFIGVSAPRATAVAHAPERHSHTAHAPVERLSGHPAWNGDSGKRERVAVSVAVHTLAGYEKSGSGFLRNRL